MYQKDGSEIKPHQTYESEDGTQFPPDAWKSRMEELGIAWVDDPVPPPLTQAELDAQFNSNVKSQIALIEAGQARAVREAALGDTTHLAAINTAIEALRATLK